MEFDLSIGVIPIVADFINPFDIAGRMDDEALILEVMDALDE